MVNTKGTHFIKIGSKTMADALTLLELKVKYFNGDLSLLNRY